MSLTDRASVCVQVDRGAYHRASLQRGPHHGAERREDDPHTQGGGAGGTSSAAVFIAAAEGQGCGGKHAALNDH